MTLCAATTNPPPQLMQLGQAQALRVFNDHQARIWHIDADFDDGGCDEKIQLMIFKGSHDVCFFSGLHASVNQTDAQPRKRFLEFFKGILCCLTLQGFAFFDQGADPIGLRPLRAGFLYALNDFRASLIADGNRGNRATPRRQFVNH